MKKKIVKADENQSTINNLIDSNRELAAKYHNLERSYNKLDAEYPKLVHENIVLKGSLDDAMKKMKDMEETIQKTRHNVGFLFGALTEAAAVELKLEKSLLQSH